MEFPSCILRNRTSRFPFESTKEYYLTTVCTEHVKYAIENQTKTKIRVHTKLRIVCYKIHCFFFYCNEFVFKKHVCSNNNKKKNIYLLYYKHVNPHLCTIRLAKNEPTILPMESFEYH